MTSLEISLALLAGFAIAAVFGYNYWIGRRRLPRVEPVRRNESGRAERGAERGEPTLELDADSGFTARDDADAHGEGRLGDAEDGDDGSLAGGARATTAPVLNPIADCIVELQLGGTLPGERVIQYTRKLRRAGSKPVIVEAAAVDSESNHRWETPGAGRQYQAIRVGVLLANRHGPLNAMEFSEFATAVQTLGEQLGALADTPDMSAVLARARDLDEMCANLDAQVGLGVEAPEALGVADLARLAPEAGCAERGNNRYARLGPNGEVLFSLALADTPNRLQLLLDVPRSPVSAQPWKAMVECAQVCAARLGGPLVDDAGRPLPDSQLERIGQQIAQRHASLEAAGFPAGSALALRLFN